MTDKQELNPETNRAAAIIVALIVLVTSILTELTFFAWLWKELGLFACGGG